MNYRQKSSGVSHRCYTLTVLPHSFIKLNLIVNTLYKSTQNMYKNHFQMIK
jgi:hypothetical protein